MIKKQLKKITLSLIFVLGVSSYSVKSYAGLPVTDPSNLVEKIASNIQQAANWASESALMTFAMEMKAYYDQAKMVLDSNLAQLSLQKTLRLEEELHNLWVTAQYEADPNAVAECAIAEVAEAVKCEQMDKVSKRVDRHQSRSANFSSSSVQATSEKVEVLEEVIDECRALKFAEPEEGKDDLSVSYCLRGGLVSGADSGNTFSEDEEKAVDKIIEILGGVGEEYKKSNDMAEGSLEQAEQINDEIKDIAIKSLAITSLEHIAAQRKPGARGVTMSVSSPLALLEEFDNEKWGSEEWKASVSAASPYVANILNPNQIQKQQVKMDAFMVHLEIIKYKQQLRMESLMAASLLLQQEEHEKEYK